MRPAESENNRNAPRARTGTIILITVLITILVMLIGYIVWIRLGPQVAEAFQPKHTEQTEQTEQTEPGPTVTIAAESYDVREEIRKNLRRLQQKPGLAKVIRESEQLDQKISLTFDGMMDDVTMLKILDILGRYELTATFFISGAQASSEPEVVKAVANAQQPVGNYTLRAREHMEMLTQTELIEDFSISNNIFMNLLGAKPSVLKGNVTEYTESFLEAAKASDLTSVVRSTTYLTYHSFRSYEEVLAYVNKLSYRSIVSVKLSGLLDASEYTPKEVVETPAIDLQPGVEVKKETEIPLSKEERLLNLVEWLARAMKEASFSPETVELRELNGGRLAEVKKGLNTTEAAVGYAFCGLGRMEELEGVLSSLEKTGGVGNFFVTAKEIEDYPEQVELLISSGQVIGIAAYPKDDDDFYAVCHEMYKARQLLEEKQYKNVRLVMQPWGEVGDVVKEAASAMQCMLVSYDIGFARSGSENTANAQVVERSIYGENTYGFRRGMVAFFRMNHYSRSNIVGDLLTTLSNSRNIYPAKDIYELWANHSDAYIYPLPLDMILPEVRGKIYTGQLRGDVLERAKTHYIGNRDIASQNQLPGFDRTEIKALDKSGKIKDSGKTAFLTFDDWGTDANIVKLLDVLRKHGVKATFFVRTEFVPDNPNLLRVIAQEGHEIASHTNTHMPLANDPENKWKFTDLTQAEALALQRDMVKSYSVLESIVGDLLLENGKPVLSRLFRPPTMAVSRTGMWAVFDCGFTYIVNASYTSRDYAAESAATLAQDLRKNVSAGSVVIMHMSDNSIYTADALDLFLSDQAKLDESKALKFARLSDYLEE